jgi:hypothetical protein
MQDAFRMGLAFLIWLYSVLSREGWEWESQGWKRKEKQTEGSSSDSWLRRPKRGLARWALCIIIIDRWSWKGLDGRNGWLGTVVEDVS